MCSLAESDLLFENEDTLSECSTEATSECSNANICKKCRTNDAVLTLRTKDRYCRDCFVTSVTHKFRSTLGKNRVMRHGDKVCVDFDGRQNSVALVKLINSSLDEKNVKASESLGFLLYNVSCCLLPDTCEKVLTDKEIEFKAPSLYLSC